MHSNRLFLQFIQWWLEDDDSKIEWEVDEDWQWNVCYCHICKKYLSGDEYIDDPPNVSYS